MKRVVVTGATGFIGRQSLPLLQAAGYEVHALSSSAVPARADGVSWHRVNLFERAEITAVMEAVRPTHLLHLAWYTEPGKYWTARENFSWVSASLTIAEAFADHGGQRLVCAGTCAEYDWRYGYCSETITPLAPATTYGICKDALRSLLDTLAIRTGLSNAWGRIFFLYGPHEHPKRLVSGVSLALLRGEPALCSHGRQIRDFLHVEDVAAAFVALLDSDVCGAVNVASGNPVRLREIIYLLADQLGRRDLVRLGALSTALDEPRLLLADTTRLEEEVGWTSGCSLERGLAQTLAWWRTQLNHAV
jgi:nucleoside-diphosphate-sugar epimerase